MPSRIAPVYFQRLLYWQFLLDFSCRPPPGIRLCPIPSHVRKTKAENRLIFNDFSDTCPSLPAQSAPADSNANFVKQWSERIAGKENEPAEKVFKNLQYLKTLRASLLLTIMDVGYSRGLGVTCTHCHVETDFASDDKRPKRAAREMALRIAREAKGRKAKSA